MEFGEILVYVILLLPVVMGLISASKGVSRENLKLPCAACKSMIPATAKVCPYCRRSAGHDVFSKKGKKCDNNSKSMRFIRTMIFTIGAEILVGGLLMIVFFD